MDTKITQILKKITEYILISMLAGAIVPLQLAMVQSFRNATNASQIQATLYLYVGGTIASLFLAVFMSGSIKPLVIQNVSWWMWLLGFLSSFYILFMFISAPKYAETK